MSQRRGTITDQLANIIQVIQLGKKTGRLTVERDDGADRVPGEIHFTHGRITQAHCGEMSGQQALNWLATWGECRFLFIPSPNGSGPQAFSPSPTQPLPRIEPHLPVSESAGSVRGPAGAEERRGEERKPGPKGDEGRSRPANTHNGITQAMGRITDHLQATYLNPHRIRLGDETLRLLDQAGLSRLHRHLFLLIDGQRSRTELARLIGRQPEELQRLLDDLERIGVIQQ